MTKEEYMQLKRFPVNPQIEFDEFEKNLRLPENVIFECYTLSETIIYTHISASLENMLFDIKQCTPDGKPVRCPYIKGSTRKSEIAERLYEGDWRIYNAQPR